MKKKYLQFNNLKGYPALLQGVLDKSNGNFSLDYGSKQEVDANIGKLCQKIGITKNNLYMMDQIHGSSIRVLGSKSFRVLENKTIPKIDGLITNKKNVFLMIKTADCFPLVCYDPVKGVVAAVHVGWRGAIEKIFLLVLLKMINNFNCKLENIIIGIGPGIRTCCFKHKKLLQSKLPEWKGYLKKEKDNFITLDIANFIKDQLIEAGISKENLELMAICTSCNKKFFSHFRSLQTGEIEGRFATVIGLKSN